MYTVNRHVALVRPKQPFLDWLLSVPDPKSLKITLEELRSNDTAFLIPDFETLEAAFNYVEKNYETIFIDHLFEWYSDGSLWPEKRDLATFREWFDVEIHDMIIDLGEDNIKRENI